MPVCPETPQIQKNVGRYKLEHAALHVPHAEYKSKTKKREEKCATPPINIDHQSLNFKHMKSSYALTKAVKHSEHVLQQNMELMRVFILMLSADNNINSDKLLLIGRF